MDREARFWARVNTSGGPNTCWPWTGARLNRGYGQVYQPNHKLLAHRVAWELECGPIPDGMSVLHQCDNPPCCNPAHLFLGTQADNISDRDQKGHHANSMKTNCLRGHPLSGDNLYVTPSGARQCRACQQVVWRRRNGERKRARKEAKDKANHQGEGEGQ